MNSWPACHEFETSTVEDPQCRGRCSKNLLMLKRSPVGVVWKLGKGASSGVVLVTGLCSKLLDPSPKELEFSNE
ncbi:hypothetical protein TNCV_786061 [Trichonephila clavipes]|nr:hypothetical protein TNCV_786061 [Trichonephila clavipes]